MTLRVVTVQEAGEAFATWRRQPAFHGIDEHPFTGGFGRSYYPVVSGLTRADRSFSIVDGDRPIAVVPSSAGQGVLDRYGLPIKLFCDRGHASYPMVVSMLFGYIDRLLQTEKLTRCAIAEHEIGGVLSPIGEACLGRGWNGELHFTGICDLAEGEPGLRRHLRKSFRSLVNWGRRNMTLTYVNAQNPDPRGFAAYREFHRVVAGSGSVRPEASWTAMYDWIVGGGGELTLGHLLTGELVAGTMVLDGTKVAYYSSGVYDRERFDKPMAHLPLYDAILRAGGRGLTTFELGEIPQAGVGSSKEYAIGYFKRGFASRIATSIVWTVDGSKASVGDDA